MNNTTAIFPPGASIFAATSGIIFIVLGLAGNLLTVVALLKDPKLRSLATTAFVLSLAISDLLFCCVHLPHSVARYLLQRRLLNDLFCQLEPFFFIGNLGASLMSMVAITINRYVKILHPRWYSRVYTRSNTWAMLALAWGFSFTLLIPSLLGVWGKFGYKEETFACVLLTRESNSARYVIYSLGFFLPCVVILAAYLRIYYQYLSSDLKAHGSTLTQRGKDMRLAKMTFAIYFGFLMCFLPSMVANIVKGTITKLPTLYIVTTVLLWASSVINPLIYAYANRQYRRAYRAVLCGAASWRPAGGIKSSRDKSSCSEDHQVHSSAREL